MIPNGNVQVSGDDDSITKSETVCWDCQLQGCLPIWIITGPVDGFHHLIVSHDTAVYIKRIGTVLTIKNVNHVIWSSDYKIIIQKKYVTACYLSFKVLQNCSIFCY